MRGDRIYINLTGGKPIKKPNNPPTDHQSASDWRCPAAGSWGLTRLCWNQLFFVGFFFCVWISPPTSALQCGDWPSELITRAVVIPFRHLTVVLNQDWLPLWEMQFSKCTLLELVQEQLCERLKPLALQELRVMNWDPFWIYLCIPGLHDLFCQVSFVACPTPLVVQVFFGVWAD